MKVRLLFILLATLAVASGQSTKNLSQFAELPEAPNAADWIYLWDSSASISKKISPSNFFKAMPVAGLTTVGGVKRNVGASGDFVAGIDASGNLVYGTPAGSGGGISITGARVPYGNGAGSITSEAGFEYSAAANQLSVANAMLSGGVLFGTDNISLSSPTPGVFYISEGTLTGDELAIDLSSDNAIRLFSGTGVGSVQFDGMDVIVPADAYDSGTWNGNNEAAPKDAIRDKFESLTAIGWASASFTGTAAYSPQTIYTGSLTAPATLTFPTFGAGSRAAFIVTATDVDAADRVITIPSSSIVGAGTSGTTFTLPLNVDTYFEVLYDGTDFFFIQEQIKAAPQFTGVGVVGGTWVDTPAPMAALAVDITKGNNTKTIATNSTFTWSATPSVAGQAWGAQVKNSGAGVVTVTMPSCRSAFGGATTTTFTIAAGGLEQVYWQYDGTNVIFFGGGDGGSGSGFPLTADADFAGYNATNIGALTATTIAGSGLNITDISGTALPSFIPSRDFGKITTAEALEYEPTTVATTTSATTTIDTTKTYSVVTLNETTETIAFSGVPAEGTPIRIRFVAHTVDCVVTTDSVYSLGIGANRTSFKVRANKPAVWDIWRSNGAWFSYEPVELSDLPANASPTTAYLVETSDPSTGASGKSTLAEVIAGTSIKTTRTGVRRTVYVNAGAMIPRTTNGAARTTAETTTNDVMYDSVDFDQTTEEGVGFWFAFPTAHNSGTVTARFHWTCASGTGNVKIDIAARGYAQDDAIDQAMGTEQGVVDTVDAAGSMHLSPTTSAITIGGTGGTNIPVYFQITRDTTTASNLAADLKLLGVTIEYTENSTEPAAQ